jgi:hypothetical protein
MPDYEGWVLSGEARLAHDETIWIHQWGTLTPFTWMGDCARLDEGTEALGETTVTSRRDPRGGLRRHSVLKSQPGEVTDTLVFKRLQFDKKRTDLKKCAWDVDQRASCEGIDADAWNKWEEIIRRCRGLAGERTNPASGYDGEDMEQLMQFSWVSLDAIDLYRIQGEIGAGPFTGVSIVDVASCQPARCASPCDQQEGCVVVAITDTETVPAGTYLSVNLYGGDLDQWSAPITLTPFGANAATQVACAGSLVVVTSVADTSVIVSPDRGATLVDIQTADMAAHAPTSVDMIDQSFIVIGGADGYIYGSRDGGLDVNTWETLDAGEATTNAITRIMIARDNPRIVYGISSAADVVVKTENGGRTWYAQAPTGTVGTGLTALCVLNQHMVLVGTDAGELFQTTDGGQSWTEQTDLPALTAATKANTTIQDIVMNPCAELGLITKNTSDDENFFLRNVDNGASGRWFQPEEMEAAAAGKSLAGLACCGNNHFVAGGGEAATDNLVMLVR